MTNRLTAHRAQGSDGGVRGRELPMRLFVIHTAGQDSAATIRAAGTLALGLGAEITLLATLEVPLPLRLEEPPVSISFTEDQLLDVVWQSGQAARVELRLCRDRIEAIRHSLPPASMVILGGRGGWIWSATRKLARLLARDGHRVFFVGGRGTS